MLINEIIRKYRFCLKADRIGPDVPFTHWQLHFPVLMRKLCKNKFRSFSDSAQFRAGAYAIGCSQISIGDRVVIRPNTMLFGETLISMEHSIIIEDDVMIGSGVHIYVNNHKFDDRNVPIIDQGYYPDQQVVLEKGCWIGANTIILPGVTIGENSVVGAGSVVTKSIPRHVVAAGNPAKILRNIG
ncbi:acyltransferase [Sphingobacterium sp. InxBP1]|uniref:acyltransferase n=1 Tax=Sphingobacterium sp. InxBP1 TaxID=2870328 RepID=UPI002ADE24BA|nr:acyltransferase [Sphingobacterium sp. InxBP1]MCW8310897.1 acyltransferase [Sphingobacterium sp. InxBP1]